jgi:hypothetical protein
VKTQIIQPEPETRAAEPPGEEGPVSKRNEAWLRRGVIFAAVAGYIVLGLLHPIELNVGDDSTVYLYLHVVQPVLIGLLAWGLWLLVKGLPGRAAQIARVAVVPYLIAYTMLDSIAGISLALNVREANGMSPADAAAVNRLMDGLGDEVVPAAVYLASGLTWLVAAVATAIAVRQVGGRGPAMLMALGAAIFAVGHPFPPGPVGIALFGLGVAWLEYRREHAPVPEAVPEAQPVLVP